MRLEGWGEMGGSKDLGIYGLDGQALPGASWLCRRLWFESWAQMGPLPSALNNMNGLMLGAKEQGWVFSHLPVQCPIECPCSFVVWSQSSAMVNLYTVTTFSAPHNGQPFPTGSLWTLIIGVGVCCWKSRKGQRAVPFLVFWGNSILFSTVAGIIP